MTRTSSALKRLGVIGIAAVTIGAGVPAFFATSAQAAGPTTQLRIDPAQQQGASGTCLIFSVTPLAADGTTPSDTASQVIRLTASSTSANEVQFCDPDPNFPAQSGNNSTSSTAPVTGARTAAVGTAEPRDAGTTGASTGVQDFGVRGLGAGGANIRAFIDSNNDGDFDAGEPTVQATATFTPGGNNQTDTSSGGNAAQDAARTITEVPQASNANPVAAGTGESSRQFVTVQVRNASGDVLSGVTVNAQFQAGSANGAQAASGSTAAQPAQIITCRTGGTTTDTNGNTTSTSTQSTSTGSQGGNGTVTNNNGIVTCSFIAARSGTDTILLFVNQTTGNTAGADSGEPQLTVTRTTQTAPNTNVSQARNIDLTPEGPINTTSGQTRTFTATVTDAAGVRVAGVRVTFGKTGGGNLTSVGGTTNSFGQVSTGLTSVAGEQGQAVVTATIDEDQDTATNGVQGTQCSNAAGTPSGATTAGNCSDSEVTNFVAATASPSTSASPSTPATTPASPSTPATTPASPSGPPNTACTTPASISLERTTITATGSSGLTVRATANSIIDVFAYSRPSTTYRVVRSAELGADGTAQFRIVPPTNTRLYAQQRGCNASPSIVLNVRTALSLNVVRNGVRTYTFSGDSLPARPGGLIISLYRVTGSGSQILTSQVRASATTGDWVIRRVFTGTGRFGFVVRTGQDLQNAPGASNVRSLLVF